VDDTERLIHPQHNPHRSLPSSGQCEPQARIKPATTQ
jgi:hypothetical protein